MKGKTDVRLRIPQDVLAGLFLVAVAAFFLWWGWDYPVGRTGRMGPGWLPQAVCAVLIVLGGAIAVRGLRNLAKPVEIALPPPRTIAAVMAATLVFVAIERLGLVLTAFAATLLASLPADGFRWPAAIFFAALLSGFCVVLFVVVLSQPLPMWPT